MSKILTFYGETPTIALREAQEKCGEDAIVIATEKVYDKNKDGKDLYKIVVAIEEEEENAQSDIAKRAQKVLNAYKKPTQTISIPIDNNQTIKAQLYDFKAQILQIQQEIKRIQKSLWEPKSKLFDIC